MIDGLTTSLVFATQCHDFVETWLCLAHFCQFEASALAVGAPVLFSVWHQSAEGMQYRAAVIWRCIGDRETATWPVTVFFFWGGDCNTNLRKLRGLGCGKKSEASSCPKNGADMCRLEGKKLLTA